MNIGNKFRFNLAQGKRGEKTAIEILEREMDGIKVVEESNKFYDFYFTKNGHKYYIEVKTDHKSRFTKNLFFEYNCNKKKSGLSDTKANKWVVLVPHLKIILYFSPKLMLAYLKNHGEKRSGGDRNAVRGFIIKLEEVRSLGFVKEFSLDPQPF